MKLIYSLLFLIVGSCLAYWVKKRRFKRINRYGVEEFKRFGGKVIGVSIEKILWWLALLCILIGAILAL
jgi:hypothetical protein